MARNDTESTTGRLAVAGAPVSYGAFEVTVGTNAWVPDPVDVIHYVADSGCEGIELGPVGYLGGKSDLSSRLHDAGLALAGGYVQLPFSEPDALAGALTELQAVLDAFDAAPNSGVLSPKPVLADAGSPVRLANPGRAATDHSYGLGNEQWKRFLDGLTLARSTCQARGYEPTFHPHAGTFVEASWEIDRLLEDTDVGVCFDTGHLIIGGIDPLRALHSWGTRINHVHLKDTNLAVIQRYMDRHEPAERYYEGEAFARLGEGDVDLAAILAAVQEAEYREWLVIEQDTVLGSADEMDQVVEDQINNRAFLGQFGL